jgi:hypothetical protein
MFPFVFSSSAPFVFYWKIFVPLLFLRDLL